MLLMLFTTCTAENVTFPRLSAQCLWFQWFLVSAAYSLLCPLVFLLTTFFLFLFEFCSSNPAICWVFKSHHQSAFRYYELFHHSGNWYPALGWVAVESSWCKWWWSCNPSPQIPLTFLSFDCSSYNFTEMKRPHYSWKGPILIHLSLLMSWYFIWGHRTSCDNPILCSMPRIGVIIKRESDLYSSEAAPDILLKISWYCIRYSWIADSISLWGTDRSIGVARSNHTDAKFSFLTWPP